MDVQITTLGALLGLAVAIILIIKKVHPAYSLILGAVVGGLVGGAGLTGTVDVMMSGAKDIFYKDMPSCLIHLINRKDFNRKVTTGSISSR